MDTLNQKILANLEFLLPSINFKLAKEDGRFTRRMSIIAINLIFSPKRHNQNLQTRV